MCCVVPRKWLQEDVWWARPFSSAPPPHHQLSTSGGFSRRSCRPSSLSRTLAGAWRGTAYLQEENYRFRCVMIFRYARTYPGDILGIFFLHIMGIFWEYLGDILGTSWAYLGDILGIYWRHPGNIFGIFWVYFSHIFDISWAFPGHILGISWAYLVVKF